MRGHPYAGAAGLWLRLWFSLSNSLSAPLQKDASGNLPARTPLLSYMPDSG